MRARAALVAEPGPGGATRLPVQRSQAPLILRRTPEGVYLVGGAAGPLGGDVLDLRIDVRDGARLRVRTAAAAVALPGRDGAESVLTVTATVGAGARLEFLPEPTVVADRARHRVELAVSLADGAALVLRDEVILGRHGERGGSCRARLRADLTGSPLLRHELDLSGADPASLGPAVLAGHRAAGSLLRVEPSWAGLGEGRTPEGRIAAGRFPENQTPAGEAPGVAVMPLAGGPAVLVTALAGDALTLRRRLSWAPAPEAVAEPAAGAAAAPDPGAVAEPAAGAASGPDPGAAWVRSPAGSTRTG